MSNTKFIAILTFAVVAFIATPIALIWALNTLFPILAIPYTVATWAAAFIVAGVFTAKIK